jgi:hypothetical protein
LKGRLNAALQATVESASANNGRPKARGFAARWASAGTGAALWCKGVAVPCASRETSDVNMDDPMADPMADPMDDPMADPMPDPMDID